MLGSMVVCALLGMLIERLAYRPVRRQARLTLLITAIGVSLLLENGGQVVFGAGPEVLPARSPRTRSSTSAACRSRTSS